MIYWNASFRESISQKVALAITSCNNGTHGYKLYYYNSKKKSELDFVIEHSGQVLPIEVKSGKDYEKHSALNNVMGIIEYAIPEAFVFSYDNVKVRERITYYPIYIVMFLQDDRVDFVDISIDIFML